MTGTISDIRNEGSLPRMSSKLTEVKARKTVQQKIGKGCRQMIPRKRSRSKEPGKDSGMERVMSYRNERRRDSEEGRERAWQMEGGKQSPEEGWMWAMLAGWVVRVGPGKDDQLGSQALGSWGHRGPVHIKGVVHWQRHGPTLPRSAGLSSLMCVGRGRGSTEPWAALPTPHSHLLLSAARASRRPAGGWDTEGGDSGSQGGARTRRKSPNWGGGEDRLCPRCLRGRRGPVWARMTTLSVGESSPISALGPPGPVRPTLWRGKLRPRVA